jgi:hypothetical protein
MALFKRQDDEETKGCRKELEQAWHQWLRHLHSIRLSPSIRPTCLSPFVLSSDDASRYVENAIRENRTADAQAYSVPFQQAKMKLSNRLINHITSHKTSNLAAEADQPKSYSRFILFTI